MGKYIVSAGLMWVSAVDGHIESNGQITAIKRIEVTNDKEKALRFDNHNGAKSTANKINSYAVVVRL